MNLCTPTRGTTQKGRDTEKICWFCTKGRHADCMLQIPVQGRTDGGPHDCAFDTSMIPCRCNQSHHHKRDNIYAVQDAITIPPPNHTGND